MKQQYAKHRLAGLLATLVLLDGCAAATVIRKQPEFDNEQRQRLMQTFQSGPVAAASSERLTRSN